VIDPAAASSRSATLLIRTWTESGMPEAKRARLLTVEGDSAPTTWSTAVGDAAIAQEVLRWLRESAGTEGLGVLPPQPGPAAAADSGAGKAPLVDGHWVQAHLADPDVVVLQVDDAASPDRPGLPGAGRLDWIRDLQHPTRRAFVDAAGFAALMDARGITETTHVVLYGDALNARAAGAYWCFAYYGHRRVSLLDGGRQRWLDEGRPVTPTPGGRAPTSGYPTPYGRAEILLTRDQLLSGLVGAPPGTTLVDCRTSEEFAGHPRKPYDEPTDRHRLPGHVPGAVNLPVEQLVDADTHSLLPPRQLAELCHDRGLTPEDQVVVYCGANDRSALLWFALHEVLAWPDVRCYCGAWAEYGSLADVPVDGSPGATS
jgi:thiosulfate/3-mercaptopyruvate sulfurtransferase